MSRIKVKDVIAGNILQISFLNVHDKDLTFDFAVAINILKGQGWSNRKYY